MYVAETVGTKFYSTIARCDKLEFRIWNALAHGRNRILNCEKFCHLFSKRNWFWNLSI